MFGKLCRAIVAMYLVLTKPQLDIEIEKIRKTLEEIEREVKKGS
jgi:hypothetical protein